MNENGIIDEEDIAEVIRCITSKNTSEGGTDEAGQLTQQEIAAVVEHVRNYSIAFCARPSINAGRKK